MASAPPLSVNPRGEEILTSMWIEFAIVTLVMIARFYTRSVLVRKLAWDDFWMAMGYLTTMMSFVLTNLAINNGFGMHVPDLEPFGPQYIVAAIKWAFISQVLGIMGVAFTRMAFIATLMALLSPSQKYQLWMLRIFFFFQVTVNSMTSLYILLQCRPTAGLWDKSIGAECLPPVIQERLGFNQGAVNSFTDLALAIFPATIIWKLNMKRSVKISLCVTMGLGIFAFATAIVKTVNLTEISADPEDLTYIMFGIQFWFPIENSTLIISATIPTLRPLISRTRGHNTTVASGSYGNHSYPRRDGTWNEIEAQPGSVSVSSDQVELTSGPKGKLGTGTDTEIVAGMQGYGRDGESLPPAPPQTGIMKTVKAYVTH